MVPIPRDVAAGRANQARAPGGTMADGRAGRRGASVPAARDRTSARADAHRGALGNDQGDDDLRARMAKLPDAELEKILSPREWDDLQRGYRERVTDMHMPHIAELPRVLPRLFSDAAGRAIEAGFDGVELHFAHAYTMASFLSALNTRPDGYGGSRENRVKLPLEVVAAVKERVAGRR